MTTFEGNGVRLFWTESGSGPTVVFVHGIPTDHRAWEAAMEAARGRFRTIAVSRRHAYPNTRDTPISDSTVGANADDLVAFLTSLGPGRVHLIGHSYGGFISAVVALRHPELLRSLVLVEPAIASLLLKDPRSRRQALGLLLRSPAVALAASRYLGRSQGPALAALRNGDPRSAVRLNVDGVNDRPGSFDALPPPLQQMMVDNARTVGETELPYPPVGRPDLAGLRVPTLVITGTTSALWLRRIGEIAASSIPAAQLVRIPDAGHYPHVDRPDAFNAAWMGFVGRSSGAP